MQKGFLEEVRERLRSQTHRASSKFPTIPPEPEMSARAPLRLCALYHKTARSASGLCKRLSNGQLVFRCGLRTGSLEREIKMLRTSSVPRSHEKRRPILPAKSSERLHFSLETTWRRRWRPWRPGYTRSPCPQHIHSRTTGRASRF